MIVIQITGVKEALRRVKKYLNPERNRIIRKAFRDAARVILRLAKRYVPIQSGTLQKSLAVKLKMYKNNGVLVAMIGPRSWFLGAFKGKKRIAHKYAHIVEGGRKGFRQNFKHWLTGLDSLRFVPAARPKPFVGRAARSGNSTALRVIEQTVALGLGK